VTSYKTKNIVVRRTKLIACLIRLLALQRNDFFHNFYKNNSLTKNQNLLYPKTDVSQTQKKKVNPSTKPLQTTAKPKLIHTIVIFPRELFHIIVLLQQILDSIIDILIPIYGTP
jgi:hypothetical protein